MLDEKYLAVFEEERFYHICTRGNSEEILFVNDENYRYFLQQCDKYLSNFLNVYAYCLLNNHIHFLVQIKEAKTDVIFLERLHLLQKKFEQEKVIDKNAVNEVICEQVRKLLISYSMAFNKQQKRKGNLFQRTFRRILIDNDAYFTTCVGYIHCNPNKHKIGDYKNYKWSSYQRILLPTQTKLAKKEVIEWFGNEKDYITFHQNYADDLLDRDFWLEE